MYVCVYLERGGFWGALNCGTMEGGGADVLSPSHTIMANFIQIQYSTHSSSGNVLPKQVNSNTEKKPGKLLNAEDFTLLSLCTNEVGSEKKTKRLGLAATLVGSIH